MKINKKIISIFLMVVLFCTFITGCNKINDSDTTTSSNMTQDEPTENTILPKIFSVNEISSIGEISYEKIYSWVLGEFTVFTDTDLFPFQYNSKYGFVDANGKVVISEQYDGVSMFSEDKAFVKIGKQLKVIDTTGKELYTIPAGYSVNTDSYFHNGIAILVNTTKKNYSEDGYEFWDTYLNALIINNDMTTSQIKIKTEEKLDYKIINTPEFQGFITYNLDRIRDYSKTGFDGYKNQVIYRLFDLSGKEIWKVIIPYETMNRYKDPAIEYLKTICNTSLISADGSNTLETFCIKNGYMNVFDENFKWGLLNLKTGEIVLEYKYDFIGGYANGLCNVCSYGKWGYVDITGNNIIPITYKAAQIFTESGGFVETNENSLMIVDKEGNIVADYGAIMCKINGSDRNRIYSNVNNNDFAVIWCEDNYYKILGYDGKELLSVSLTSKSSPLIITDNYIFADERMYKIEK